MSRLCFDEDEKQMYQNARAVCALLFSLFNVEICGVFILHVVVIASPFSQGLAAI